MPITAYQSKYLAYELTKRCPSDSVEKLARAAAGAQMDLNPHQVDAALFAFRSREAQIQRSISERNAHFYEEEAAKLDGWVDDLKAGLEREIKEFDRQTKETRRASTTVLTLEEKLESQKRIKAIENQRNDKRRSLFEAQDAIDSQREILIARIEGKLLQESLLTPLSHGA